MCLLHGVNEMLNSIASAISGGILMDIWILDDAAALGCQRGVCGTKERGKYRWPCFTKLNYLPLSLLYTACSPLGVSVRTGFAMAWSVHEVCDVQQRKLPWVQCRFVMVG